VVGGEYAEYPHSGTWDVVHRVESTKGGLQ